MSSSKGKAVNCLRSMAARFRTLARFESISHFRIVATFSELRAPKSTRGIPRGMTRARAN
jgi:hypothetical protein